KLVLEVLRVAQRRSFRIRLTRLRTGIGVLENVESLSVGGHDAVFNAVVDHLHEMPGPDGSAMQIAHAGRAVGGSRTAAAGWRRPLPTWRECCKNRLDRGDNLLPPPNHQAESVLKSEHTAAGTNIDIVDTVRPQLFGSTDIVVIVRIAAIDDHIATLQ